ncbi:DUF2933 domain-containing protein [Candidatus Roizmanbacteria bacterium]|nr:DUF2933 domain-containing protein [Candidatus Roizmanbacteria bacterium]
MMNLFLKSHWFHCVLIIALALIASKVFNLSFLSLLPLLVCPIMMVFMMRGHNHKK